MPDVGASARATPRRLLVLGGTGFIGPHIIEAALARGWHVTMFNRGKTHPELFPEVERRIGDRDGKLDALRDGTWDAVVDTSGYVPRLVRDSAMLLRDRVEQYVFVSSISAYAEFSVANIPETHPLATMPDPTIEDVMPFYGALKALCEQAAEAALPGRTTNVRPGFIVGPLDPTDRFTYWPVRVARGGTMIAPGTAVDPIQFIDARDLAAWIIGAIEGRHVGAFNLVGPATPMPVGELLQHCIEVSGSDTKLEWVPTEFLVAHELSPGGDLPIWVPPEGESLGFGQISNAKAIATGLKFRPVRDTVADTLAWFRTLPPERQSTLRAGLSAEREAKVLAAWQGRGKGSTKRAGKRKAA